MLEIPALLLGLWCSPVRWQLNNNLLVYTRSQCWAGDNFLVLEPRQMRSPIARCDLGEITQLGEGKWNANTELAYHVRLNCAGGMITWRQKLTIVTNGWMRVSSDWIEYIPGYTGPGRTLIRW